MDILYRIIRFKNNSQTADHLPSMRHPITGKIMLFTSYETASKWIKENYSTGSIQTTFPDEFTKTVTKRYEVIDGGK